MKLADHADRTEKLVGIRAEDIHKWIDGFFDAESFEQFLRTGRSRKFNPYSHRKYRHCLEALDDAYKEFEHVYTRDQIKAVFACHLRDDYGGYLPREEDFASGGFRERFHETGEREPLERILSEEELSEYFKGKAYAGYQKSKQKLSGAFYWRIVWPSVITALLFAVSAFTIIIPLFRESMLRQKKDMIRELISTAASSIEFYIHQEQSGAMTRTEAQRLAAAEVSELRYGIDNKDYFWITDMHPHMIMHPYRPELIGKDLTGYTDHEDKSGKKLFEAAVSLVEKSNEGYLEYLWQWMDDPNRAEPKLSYVQGIAEWGWVIGTGVYIHDVEAEIGRLTRKLLIADTILAVVLFCLLGNILLQSRRLELNRQRAEVGLQEARDRYRALVESSNEGCLLELGGRTVYSNHTISRISGYSEPELLSRKLWELLDENADVNVFARKHLQEIYAHKAGATEFDARLATKDGRAVDVQITTSRIFFVEKDGHVISVRPLHRSREETLEAYHRSGKGDMGHRSDMPHRIDTASTPGQLIAVLKELPQQIRYLHDHGATPGLLREAVGSCYDAATRYFTKQALEAEEPIDTPFVFLSLGSTARHEMTLFSDQDNALLFADVPAGQLGEVRQQFLTLSDRVCSNLKQAGYPTCPGGIMAVNPAWCLSLSEWKNRFDSWIEAATPEAMLKLNVAFDLRSDDAENTLLMDLRAHVRESIATHKVFLHHYAINCLGYKAPLGLFGRLVTGNQSGRRTINLKECLKPLETFARLYAVKYGIAEPGTIARLRALHAKGVLEDETLREMTFIFDHLWQLRFFNHVSESAVFNDNADELDISRLSQVERDILKDVLARIPVFQTSLSYEFLGRQL